MTGLAAVALTWALLSPVAMAATADDQALAAELLALADAPARERWLEAHREKLSAELGREVAAQARVLYLADRNDPAYDAFALALRIGEIAGDPESRIRGLEGLGGVERFRGRAQEALPFLERAMQEAEASADQAAVGRILGQMGSARRRLGEFGAALELSERQLAVFERLGDAEWIGRAHNYVGIALGALGRCAEAVPHLSQSLAACEAADNDRTLCAPIHSNLGLCHEYLGNYAAALQALDRSIEITQTTGKPTELAATLNNIGELYRLQGAPLRALDYYHRAYAAAAEPGEKEFMADALANEGGALLELDRTEEARVAFERARKLGEEIHSPSVITGAAAGAAEGLSRRGDRVGALQLLERGLESAERTGERQLEARTRRQIAGLKLADGQADVALELAGQAAETARRYELREELWPALLVAGRADRALARAGAAEAALREAVEVVEDLRAHAVGPEADRAVFLVPHAAPYQELVSLLADRGRSWDALAVAERSKGRALLDVLAGGRMAIGAALSEADKAEERRLEGDVLTVNSELRDLLQRPSPDAARKRDLESRRSARRLALEDWRTRAYAAHPELRVLRGESPPLTPGDVGSPLADGRTVLLEYALGDPHAYLFVLSAGAASEPPLAVHRLDPDSAELVRLAHDLRARLAGRDMAFAEPAARLYQALLSPAGDALRGARRVVIVPDGALWDLPFQALRAPSGRFLIEDLAVSYAPSLSVLRDMRTRPRAHARPAGALLAIGNPDLGPGAARRAPAALLSSPLAPVPELETQVREIARLYDPGSTAVRVGVGAREAWLKAEAPHYRILHLASHGVLDDLSPLYSELVLASPAAGDRDDGLLEAREILDLDLGADLAVLSACETGRGRAGAGEGLIGMTWAFFVAGCPTTVASQWKVEAESTNRLMLAFHRELRSGKPPAEALRLAALAQLQRADQRHPFYWAGFVAMGDAYSSATLPSR
jgi:CHAT domain-containing protein/tetratricopeptide (TPR) repeat protein